MAKTILITGAAGFIGFHLSKALLLKGYNVIGLDNLNDYYDVNLKNSRLKILNEIPNFIFYKMDISEGLKIKEKIDIICHLGAHPGIRPSMANPVLYEKSNILGTLQVFEYARKNNINQIVYASSSSVYGNNKNQPLKEEYENNKQLSLYAATKKTNEILAYVYYENYKINMTGLRFFTVYGPYGRPDMAIYKFVKNILENKEIDIYNHGEMKRDFTFIEDIINGILKAIEKNYEFEIFNLGRGESVYLMDLVKIIETYLGKQAKINYLPMQKGEALETLADITKAKKMLDYAPSISINEGVKEFIDWYSKYSNNL